MSQDVSAVLLDELSEGLLILEIDSAYGIGRLNLHEKGDPKETLKKAELMAEHLVDPVMDYPAPVERATIAKQWCSLIFQELHELICTDSDRYKDLRKKVRDFAGKGQAGLLSTISVAIAHVLGIFAGLVTPIVGIGLLVFVRIGKEAWCASMKS